ncbi:MAG: hypothetical protein RIF46_14000 [Cyclobacteriaceae bacterium]
MKTVYPLLFALLILSCQPQTKKESQPEANETDLNNDQSEVIEEAPPESLSPSDSAFMNGFLEQLKGIEKFVVRNNYYMLSAVLKAKGDSATSSKIMKTLKSVNENNWGFEVITLDSRNGFIEYYPKGAEVTITSCYWNVSDGSKLIGTEAVGCGPVCESELSFTRFANGKYEQLENEKVIPGIGTLSELLVPDIATQIDPFEFRYLLPRKGKDIQFCLEQECVTLEWNDGTFIIKN